MRRSVQVGKKFAVRVPLSLAINLTVNLSGTRRPTVEVVNSTSFKQPSITYQGQEATVHFDKDTPAGSTIELLIEENGVYLDPNFIEQVEQSRAYRDEVEDSYEKLFPVFNVSTAMTFDQCYWTRGIGQVEIIKQLEIRHGELWRKFGLFGGVGFGGVLALSLAAGYSAEQVAIFWMGPLQSALSQAKAAITGQRDPAPVKKALKRFFFDKKNKLEPTLKDLRVEVYIPLMDLSGNALVITKKAYPMMRIADAAALACLDPIEFKMKAEVQGYSVIGSPFVKSVDGILAKSNPGLVPASVGAAARIIDHGTRHRTVENLAIINQERLMRLSMIGTLSRTRYECTPIDAYRKFDFSRKAIAAALNSAYGAV